MKRILFLLLLTVSVYGQNPSRFAKIQITGNTTSGTATKVNVQEANGEVNTQSINSGFNKNIGLGSGDVVGATTLLNQYSATPSDWVAQTYTLGSVVFYGGKQWIATSATVAGDVPSVSSKWEEMTFESLANKTVTVDQTIIDGSTNAVSGNAVFDGLALKANIASPTFTGTVGGITKSMVGLGSVDNTSDLNKPISTATQTALNNKANISQLHNPVTIGTANGLSLSTQQLSLGLASSGVTGALSGTDWNVFNGKFNTPTGLATNYLPKWNGSVFGNSQVFDNGTNVGIGISPQVKLEVNGSIRSSTTDSNSSLESYNQGSSGFPVLQLRNNVNGVDRFWNIENGRLVNGDLGFYNEQGQKITIKGNGNTLFGKTTDAGDGRVQVNGNITASPAVSPNQVVVKSQLDAVASSGTYTPSNQTNATQTVNFIRSYWKKNGNVLTVTTSLTYTVTQIQSSSSFLITLPNGFLVSGASNGRIIGSSLLHTQGIFNNNANMKAYETSDSSKINLQANFQATVSSGTYETTIIYTVLIQ